MGRQTYYWLVMPKISIKPNEEAVKAFWKYWEEHEGTGEDTCESTLGAINAALAFAGVETHEEDKSVKMFNPLDEFGDGYTQ